MDVTSVFLFSVLRQSVHFHPEIILVLFCRFVSRRTIKAAGVAKRRDINTGDRTLVSRVTKHGLRPSVTPGLVAPLVASLEKEILHLVEREEQNIFLFFLRYTMLPAHSLFTFNILLPTFNT